MSDNEELHLVFGTGPVGLAVMDELVGKGKRVRMVNRSGRASVAEDVEVIQQRAKPLTQMSSWTHESLLRRPQTQDSRSPQARHPKIEAAQLFGVSLSSVKRFAKMDREGLSLAPRKPPGRPRKADEAMSKLEEADLLERPAATASERRRYLEHMTGQSTSDSTLRRLVRR